MFINNDIFKKFDFSPKSLKICSRTKKIKDFFPALEILNEIKKNVFIAYLKEKNYLISIIKISGIFFIKNAIRRNDKVKLSVI
jgi:hypothetical protein